MRIGLWKKAIAAAYAALRAEADSELTAAPGTLSDTTTPIFHAVLTAKSKKTRGAPRRSRVSLVADCGNSRWTRALFDL